jgi:hypothetical protein
VEGKGFGPETVAMAVGGFTNESDIAGGSGFFLDSTQVRAEGLVFFVAEAAVFVGGSQRDGGGTGVVVAGTERVHYQTNPWRELAVRELEQAASLWRLQQYRAVAEVLRRARVQFRLVESIEARESAIRRIFDRR